MPQLVFFVGKGGVGKTTVSAAYALRTAAQNWRERVLVVSTDPAHSLGDVFETTLGKSPKPIQSRQNLAAWEMDSEKLFRSFLGKHKRGIIDAVERGSLFTAQEISSLLDTTLPGLAEIGALLAIQDASESRKYSTIVVDTAPFGHTLRLFGLPEQFEKLLNFLELAAERDQVLASHFGGKVPSVHDGFVERWRVKLKEIRATFDAATLFLVTTGEDFALNESIRCIRELRKGSQSITLGGIVLNRVSRISNCSVCKEKSKAAKSAGKVLKRELGPVELYVGEDLGFPMQGAKELRQFSERVFAKKKPRRQPEKRLNTWVAPVIREVEWPCLSESLTFVLGKGGVGKTTISAALGFHSRQTSANEVEICSVDPAPSLGDIFGADVTNVSRPVLGDPGYCASEFDSATLYRKWVGEIRAEIEEATSVRQPGVYMDLSYERRLFSELLEIVPPGLDEVLAIFRIAELSGPEKRTIVDMAPTGHGLELLQTPDRILVWSRLLLKSLASHRKLALAREAAVRIAELEVKARELSRALQSTDVAVYTVMLPEPLPDRETERLVQALRKLRIEPKAIFVNRVLSGKGKTCSRCRNAAAWQSKVLSGLKKKLNVGEIYVVPAFQRGPAGKRGLGEITRKLWQLA